jgi:nicotinamide mononucleotide adenylyltransferase
VRRRMARGKDWQELVPEPVAGVIKAINGEERIKAVVAQQHDRMH